jgi:hypothetical protein
MKKLLSILLAGAILCTLFVPVSGTADPSPTRDADIFDALDVLKHVVGMVELSPIEKYDHNEDGVINIFDALEVLKGIVGMRAAVQMPVCDCGTCRECNNVNFNAWVVHWRGHLTYSEFPQLISISSKDTLREVLELKDQPLCPDNVNGCIFCSVYREYADDFFNEKYLVLFRFGTSSTGLVAKVERVEHNGDIFVKGGGPLTAVGRYFGVVELDKSFQPDEFRVIRLMG